MRISDWSSDVCSSDLDVAQSAFDRVSFDLIYARPGQTQAERRAELNRALGFGSSHLSLYKLTIEPGTRFATLASRGELTNPGDNDGAALFTLTQNMTEDAGLPASEVSHPTRPGEGARDNRTNGRAGDHESVAPRGQ